MTSGAIDFPPRLIIRRLWVAIRECVLLRDRERVGVVVKMERAVDGKARFEVFKVLARLRSREKRQRRT